MNSQFKRRIVGLLLFGNLSFALTAYADTLHIVVSKNSLDYPSIASAVAAINPSASQPYIIEVLPGIYNECELHLKNYINLRGTGHDSTTVQCQTKPAQNTMLLNKLRQIEISGLRFTGSAFSAIKIYRSRDITIKENLFEEQLKTGIRINASKSVLITENTFRIARPRSMAISTRNSNAQIINNGFFRGYNATKFQGGSPTIAQNLFDGVLSTHGSTITLKATKAATVTDNTIENSSYHGISIRNADASNTISHNKIIGNRGNGIYMHYAKPTIMHNTITSNGASSVCQICVDIRATQSLARIRNNTFDTFNPAIQISYQGQNTKSDGTLLKTK